MAKTIWHNAAAQGDEKSMADKLNVHGDLRVKSTNGKHEFAGPHSLKIERNVANGFAIHITPQGSSEPIIVHIERNQLEEADLKGCGEYYAQRDISKGYKPEPSVDIADVRDFFCKKAEPIIQKAFADTKRITDTGSTAYYLASQMLNMEISAQSRIGGQSTGIAKGR